MKPLQRVADYPIGIVFNMGGMLKRYVRAAMESGTSGSGRE
jgi:hypothetical protein